MKKFKRSVIASALAVTALTAGVAGAAAVAPVAHASHGGQHTQPVAADMGPRTVVKTPGF